jgi:hydroxymethylbilane synthase
MMSAPVTLRLGTRGSLLALAQSRLVAADLQALYPDLKIETIIIKTTGDQMPDQSLADAGGKGLFVKELEQAILAGQIDFAVHSYKDVPATMPLMPLADQQSLRIAATPKRHDPRDLLISAKAATLRDLPRGARVATGSLRRQCQLLALRPDLQILPIRGNIDTRLKKFRDGQFDALILASAGIHRAGLFDPSSMHLIPLEEILPAPCQGVLALQCRRDDHKTIEFISRLNDEPTKFCAESERTVVRILDGDCHSPIAALAEFEGRKFHVRALVGNRDGSPPVISAAADAPHYEGQIVAKVCHELLARGAAQMLHPTP